mgnify:CR=1 FL=1
MYVPMKGILTEALSGHYAVPALMSWDESSFRALCEVGMEEKSPIISITPRSYIKDPRVFGLLMGEIANEYPIPIASCMDHTGTYEEAVTAIANGFTSVMVDRSKLPLEENIRQVKELVKMAHAAGMTVEAELGHVGLGVGPDSSDAFTRPQEASRFVLETGVDCLAVAVGTAHGVYKGTPKIQFDLIDRISHEVQIPLVLHGGSGSGDDNLKKCSGMAICKINIANDLFRAAYQEASQADMSGNNVYYLYDVMTKGYKRCAKHYIELLGAAGKA